MVDQEKVFLMGDVDAIKQYVFETSFLPQIRGGSQLLLDCEDEVCKYVRRIGGEEIYCGGGGFLFEIPRARAKEAKEAIERAYLQRTLAATVKVVFEEYLPLPAAMASPGDGWAARLYHAHAQIPLDGQFAHRVALLAARLQEAKHSPTSAPFWEALPFGKRCEACGKRMASEEVWRSRAEEERAERLKLCPVCLKRHQTGYRGKKERTRGEFNRRFQSWFQEFAPLKAEQPRDLDHMVAGAKRGYIAFLYADGNEMGSLLRCMASREEFAAFSQALRQGTQEALFLALKEVCGQALITEEYWPFEIINVGGDDVTLLIQAGYAWEIAVSFLSHFEKEVRRRVVEALGSWPSGWPEQLTAACGIAIADVKYPVQYLERLASGLLAEAKEKAKKAATKPASAVNFLWLPNPVLSESPEPLLDYYQRERGGRFRLTGRPYTLAQAQELARLAEKAAQWPRSQRHRWGEALEAGVLVSLNTIYYSLARRREEDRLSLWDFLNQVGRLVTGSKTMGLLWAWDEAGEEYCTSLLDVLELAELRATRRTAPRRE